MHYFTNFSKSRKNPHTTWIGREIADNLSSEDRRRVGRAITDLEEKVWSRVGYGQHADFGTIMATLNHHKDVVVGVAFAKEGQEFGPYVAYVISYEIDKHEAEQDMDIEELEDAAGMTYDELMRIIPSGKLFYIEDMVVDQSVTGMRQGMSMFKALLNDMRAHGHGFVGLSRVDTGYKLLKSREKKGDVTILYDELYDEDFFGNGDGVRLVIGYFNKSGENTEDKPGVFSRLFGRGNPGRAGRLF